MTIEIQVNGQLHTCDREISLLTLLEQMSLNPQLVAVEYNGEILQRKNWHDTQLLPSDRIEIVTIVGGG
jgi:sulfur carrier protein